MIGDVEWVCGYYYVDVLVFGGGVGGGVELGEGGKVGGLDDYVRFFCFMVMVVLDI